MPILLIIILLQLPIIGFAQYEFKEKGLYNVNYIAAMPSYKMKQLGFGLSANTGYMFNRYIGVGLGLGIDMYDLGNSFESVQPGWGPVSTISPIDFVVPVSLDVRGYIFGKEIAYYYAASIGYGFIRQSEDVNVSDANGGLMFQPALGIRIGGKKHFNVCVDLGVKFQKVDFITNNFFESGTDHYFIDYKRFIFRIGLQI